MSDDCESALDEATALAFILLQERFSEEKIAGMLILRGIRDSSVEESGPTSAD